MKCEEAGGVSAGSGADSSGPSLSALVIGTACDTAVARESSSGSRGFLLSLQTIPATASAGMSNPSNVNAADAAPNVASPDPKYVAKEGHG